MKNSLPILCLLILFTFQLQAQSKFHFGFSLQPGFSSSHFHKDNPTRGLFKEQSQAKLALSGSFLLEYEFTPKLRLRTGLKWVNMGWTYKEKREAGFRYGNQQSNGGFDPSISNYDKVKLKFNYNYIGVPLELRYRFSEAASSFYVLGGVNQLIHLNQATQVVLSKEGGGKDRKKESDEMTEFRMMNATFIGGVGYELALNEQMAIFIEPRFEWMAWQVTEDNIRSNRLYTFGVNMGLLF